MATARKRSSQDPGIQIRGIARGMTRRSSRCRGRVSGASSYDASASFCLASSTSPRRSGKRRQPDSQRAERQWGWSLSDREWRVPRIECVTRCTANRRKARRETYRKKNPTAIFLVVELFTTSLSLPNRYSGPFRGTGAVLDAQRKQREIARTTGQTGSRHGTMQVRGEREGRRVLIS